MLRNRDRERKLLSRRARREEEEEESELAAVEVKGGAPLPDWIGPSDALMEHGPGFRILSLP